MNIYTRDRKIFNGERERDRIYRVCLVGKQKMTSRVDSEPLGVELAKAREEESVCDLDVFVYVAALKADLSGSEEVYVCVWYCKDKWVGKGSVYLVIHAE